jgi:hypothetical protein
VTTGIACGLLLCLALVLFARELRLWRGRREGQGPLFQYTRRRLARRVLGCALLALVAVATFLGLEVLDFTGHLSELQIYWAAVGVLCLALLVIPFLDFRETSREFSRDRAAERLVREMEREKRGPGANCP